MFSVDSRRIQVLKNIKYEGGTIVYWMQRDKRSVDNWALLYAQEISQKNNSPLHVCFSLNGNFPNSNIRQYGFMLKGLKETAMKLKERNIGFSIIRGNAVYSIPEFIERNNIGFLITDFSPLRVYKKRTQKVAQAIKIPYHIVDANNIIPVWETSQKQEYAAHTVRPKVHKKLDEFLTDYYPLLKQDHSSNIKSSDFNYSAIIDQISVDKTVNEADWIYPGEESALKSFNIFKDQKLEGYDLNRNDPNSDSLSKLSPFIHFGQISTQRIALDTIKSSHLQAKDVFIEQLVVRKELAENFCHYNKNYDSFLGFTDWAKKTLNEHRKDKREYIYDLDTFENGDTHDELWNAAQNQMVFNGKMHGFLRMYWAKKILEWSLSPEHALQIAIDLNDKYELDGRDPKGYTGIAWSIGGIHDRPWFERPIFGKIRYMNLNGCKRKFNVERYIEKNKRS